jgi:hypothetical protein
MCDAPFKNHTQHASKNHKPYQRVPPIQTELSSTCAKLFDLGTDVDEPQTSCFRLLVDGPTRMGDESACWRQRLKLLFERAHA